MENVPRHIGVILDGNRRYAKKIGLNPFAGHRHGINNVRDIIKWCSELGIKELSLYTFSTENFKRHKEEVDFLMNLYRGELARLKGTKNKKGDVKIRFIGKLDMFPKDIRKGMEEVMKKTESNKGIIVNFCIAYGSKGEIVEACRKIAEEVKRGSLKTEEIDEGLFTKHLWLPSDADLMIRPGGEIRISNFLLWQNAYSEFIFTPKLWPEFTKEDLINCIKEYQRRERRFGE